MYGPWAIIISAFAPRQERVRNLMDEMRESGGVTDDKQARDLQQEIESLLDMDASEEHSFGQNVRSAFALADFFVDLTNNPETEIRRFVRLIFQDRTSTPSPSEFAMFQARAAALRSSSPGLQVGAAITDSSGELVGVGTNEVPDAGGGFAWDEQRVEPGHHDHRDLAQVEGSTFGEIVRKRELVMDTMQRLSESEDLLTPHARRLIKARDLGYVEKIRKEVLRGSQLTNVIEFQRPVHAEMAALVNALRHGTAVSGGTLYVTAFPCHICAKHILAAGIKKVVYVEPYPKSRASHFYPEAIRLDREGPSNVHAVDFEQFIGIGPTLYATLFAAREGDRMSQTGQIKKWRGGDDSLPRLGLGDEERANWFVIRANEWGALNALYSAQARVKSWPIVIRNSKIARRAGA